MSDLLPCPFCEHPSEMYPENLIQGMFTAWCPKCQASMWKATKAEAIAAWNRRAGRQAERDSERTPQPEPADGDPISRAVDRAVQLTREQEVEPLRKALDALCGPASGLYTKDCWCDRDGRCEWCRARAALALVTGGEGGSDG